MSAGGKHAAPLKSQSDFTPAQQPARTHSGTEPPPLGKNLSLLIEFCVNSVEFFSVIRYNFKEWTTMIIFQGVNEMSDINFTVTERGYEITEVNKYITMIQQEYANAVAWGEEMERKYEELKKSIDEYGLFFTISEENQNEVISNVFAELSKTVAQSKAEADRKSREIIESANKQAREIKRQAMENSVEIRTQNTTIMNNLKAVNEMISVVVEKGLQY